MSLTIRRENLPVRCEICHQTDLFDPETGQCGRCEPVNLQGRRNSANQEHLLSTVEIYGQNQSQLVKWLIGLFIPTLLICFWGQSHHHLWVLIPLAAIDLFAFFKIFPLDNCPACACPRPLTSKGAKSGRICRKCGVQLVFEED